MIELSLPVHDSGKLYTLDKFLNRDVAMIHIYPLRKYHNFRYSYIDVGPLKQYTQTNNRIVSGGKQINLLFSTSRFHLKLDRRHRPGKKLGSFNDEGMASSYVDGQLTLYNLCYRPDLWAFHNKKKRASEHAFNSLGVLKKYSPLSSDKYHALKWRLSKGLRALEDYLYSRGYSEPKKQEDRK